VERSGADAGCNVGPGYFRTDCGGAGVKLRGVKEEEARKICVTMNLIIFTLHGTLLG
jgi:hypothetical protein